MINRRPRVAPGTIGLGAGAASLALLASLVLSIEWWHPYCDAQVDGPGYYAWGLPLPYAEPTGVSSMEFTYLPHVLALNLVILGIAAFALLRFFVRRYAPGPGPRARMASTAGVVVLLLLGAFYGIWLSNLGIPDRTSSFSSDSYWSYRPRVLALRTGHQACDM